MMAKKSPGGQAQLRLSAFLIIRSRLDRRKTNQARDYALGPYNPPGSRVFDFIIGWGGTFYGLVPGPGRAEWRYPLQRGLRPLPDLEYGRPQDRKSFPPNLSHDRAAVLSYLVYNRQYGCYLSSHRNYP